MKNMTKEQKTEILAEAIWDKINETEYDPMHPLWHTFDDPIKDEIRGFAAKFMT